MWRAQGHRTAAVMLAALEGVATGQAQNTLANGRRLEQLPGTEAALRAGELSGPKVTELTGAGILAPEREASLLSGADRPPPGGAGAVPAVPGHLGTGRPEGPDQTDQGARPSRRGPTPGGLLLGRDTPDRGAQILSHLGSVATGLRRARRAAGGTAPSRAGRPGRRPLRPGHETPPPTRGRPFRPPPGFHPPPGPPPRPSGPEPGIPGADAEDTLDGETDVTTTDGKTETGPDAQETTTGGRPPPIWAPSSTGPRPARWWSGWTSTP